MKTITRKTWKSPVIKKISIDTGMNSDTMESGTRFYDVACGPNNSKCAP